MINRPDGTLDRRAAVAALLRDPGTLLVVSGLGAPSYDVAASGDRALNFYLWGAMGGATMVGLGLALAQPARHVLVVTGDGDMLMGLGSLATIAAAKAPNLAVAVLDNARFGETGAQRSHTGHATDLEAVAAACGWRTTTTVHTVEEVERLSPRLRREPLFAVLRISPLAPPRHLPPRSGTYQTDRFHQALGIAAS